MIERDNTNFEVIDGSEWFVNRDQVNLALSRWMFDLAYTTGIQLLADKPAIALSLKQRFPAADDEQIQQSIDSIAGVTSNKNVVGYDYDRFLYIPNRHSRIARLRAGPLTIGEEDDPALLFPDIDKRPAVRTMLFSPATYGVLPFTADVGIGIQPLDGLILARFGLMAVWGKYKKLTKIMIKPMFGVNRIWSEAAMVQLRMSENYTLRSPWVAEIMRQLQKGNET